MLNDFDLILQKFESDISIFPVSDVHLGALEHCEREWATFCSMISKEPNAYIILGGDLINNGVRTCNFVNPFDELLRPKEQKKRMIEYLAPIKDRIICAVSGNHERRTMKDSDQDITYDILTKLDKEDIYRQNAAFVKVTCGDCAYTFTVTHGAGGGIYTGATVNRNERFGNVIDGCDCLIVGHTHKGTVSKPSKIVIDTQNNKVTMKHYVVISCVSWLNYGGYAMQKMLLPAYVCNPQKLVLASGHHERKRIGVIW